MSQQQPPLPPHTSSDESKGSSNSRKYNNMTNSLRRTFKAIERNPTFSAPSSQRSSLHLDKETAVGAVEEAAVTKPHILRRSHRQSARSLVELLRPTSASSNAKDKDNKPSLFSSSAWRIPRKKLHASKMLRKLGAAYYMSVGEQATNGRKYRDKDDYPFSDGAATGSKHSSLERKRIVEGTYKQAKEMAKQLGTQPLNRMEIAEFVSRADWISNAALQSIQTLLCTRDGIVYDINPEIVIRGAVNSGYTSCYIDSLLMSLFSAQQSCDGLLYIRDLGNEEANQLQTICRLLVNYIRSGELISTGLMEEMRDALIRCGWQGTLSNSNGSRLFGVSGHTPRNTQQDVGELYMFLMERLQMPYLPLEVRMVHGADQDEADSRMVTQRVIELSLPESTSNDNERPLVLYELLERHFFDNRVEQIERNLTGKYSNDKDDSDGDSDSGTNSLGEKETVSDKTKVRTNAWSILSVYPFYTPENEINDSAAAKMAAEYPDGSPLIVPFLLKRYAVDDKGAVHRIHRRVKVPLVLDVTGIVSSGYRPNTKEAEASGHYRQQSSFASNQLPGSAQTLQSPPPYPNRVQYKLVLRSAICHKGPTANAGHYISFCTRLRSVLPRDRTSVDSGIQTQKNTSQSPSSVAMGRRPTYTSSSILEDMAEPTVTVSECKSRSWPDVRHATEESSRPPPYYRSNEEGEKMGSGITAEIMRFDDMDIGHGRIQNFSTNEGGKRCLEEISQDGYMLFYSLQRVEPDDTLTERPPVNLLQSMDELTCALKRDARPTYKEENPDADRGKKLGRNRQ